MHNNNTQLQTLQISTNLKETKWFQTIWSNEVSKEPTAAIVRKTPFQQKKKIHKKIIVFDKTTQYNIIITSEHKKQQLVDI